MRPQRIAADHRSGPAAVAARSRRFNEAAERALNSEILSVFHLDRRTGWIAWQPPQGFSVERGNRLDHQFAVEPRLHVPIGRR